MATRVWRPSSPKKVTILVRMPPQHSELEGVGKVPIKFEYTGQCGMKWTIISHIKHWNPMRASKDMATLICKFWEPWKTNFIFLHFRWCWYRFWCFFDFQDHHLFICCPIKLNYGNPEIENALDFLKFIKTHILHVFLTTNLHITKIIFITWNEN